MCLSVTSDVLTGTSDDPQGVFGIPKGIEMWSCPSNLVPLLLGSERTYNLGIQNRRARVGVGFYPMPFYPSESDEASP